MKPTMRIEYLLSIGNHNEASCPPTALLFKLFHKMPSLLTLQPTTTSPSSATERFTRYPKPPNYPTSTSTSPIPPNRHKKQNDYHTPPCLSS